MEFYMVFDENSLVVQILMDIKYNNLVDNILIINNNDRYINPNNIHDN
jgi:hypothetical protein